MSDLIKNVPLPSNYSLTLSILRERHCSPTEIEEYYTNLRKLRRRIHPKGPWAPYPAESFINAPDGVKIFVQAFVPAQPRIFVIAQHGNNVQSDLFYPLADHLFAQNIALIGVDNRGHGRSDPGRGQLNHPERMYLVYDQIIQYYTAQYPGAIFHMLGESLGTTMTAGYINSSPFRMRQFSSIIFMVPPLRVHILNQFIQSKFFLGLIKAIMHLGILISLDQPFLRNGQDFRPSYFREYHKIDQKDPIRNPKNSIRHFMTAIELFAQFKAWIRQIICPLFILEGTADQILDFRGSIELFNLATRANRKLHIYKGSDHSLMMDKNATTIYDELLAWIEKYSQPKNR